MKYMLGIFCLFFVGCSISDSGFHSKSGFRFDPPSGWQVGPDLDAGVSLTQKESGGIIVVSRSPSHKSDTEIISWYESQKKLDSKGVAHMGGKNGVNVQYTNMLGSKSFLHKDAWIQEGGKLYSVGCTLGEKQREENLAVCNAVIESLTIE